MFERFTQQAREVVVLAHEEARELGAEAIGTEHLLLALARDRGAAAGVLDGLGLDHAALRAELARVGDGLDAAALAAIGIDLDEVRRRVEAAFGPGRWPGAAAGGCRSRPRPRRRSSWRCARRCARRSRDRRRARPARRRARRGQAADGRPGPLRPDPGDDPGGDACGRAGRPHSRPARCWSAAVCGRRLDGAGRCRHPRRPAARAVEMSVGAWPLLHRPPYWPAVLWCSSSSTGALGWTASPPASWSRTGPRRSGAFLASHRRRPVRIRLPAAAPRGRRDRRCSSRHSRRRRSPRRPPRRRRCCAPGGGGWRG